MILNLILPSTYPIIVRLTQLDVENKMDFQPLNEPVQHAFTHSKPSYHDNAKRSHNQGRLSFSLTCLFRR